MKLSAHGIEFIASFEGFRAKAYKPVASERFWTIGYGHYGADVREGEVISHERGLELLAKDVAVAERAVNAAIAKLRWKFTQNAFDALVSFVFNCGPGTLATSKSLGGALRRGLRAVPAAMALYVKDASGHTLLGLKRRRDAEGKLFVTRETAASWLTRDELKRVREFDALRAKAHPTEADRLRSAELAAWMTAARKRIWHAATEKGSRGWDYRDRRQRYNSLLSRTRGSS